MDPSSAATTEIDQIDRGIIATLRNDGRITWRDLGTRVGLAPSSTADRVRRLEELGVIRKYQAVIDPGALGIRLRAMVDARLDPSASPSKFEALLARTPEVQQAAHVTGAFDYTVLLACPDVATLDRLLRGWKDAHGMIESSTRIVLQEIELS